MNAGWLTYWQFKMQAMGNLLVGRRDAVTGRRKTRGTGTHVGAESRAPFPRQGLF